MTDAEKIEALVKMIKELRRMVGFFKKGEIDMLLQKVKEQK